MKAFLTTFVASILLSSNTSAQDSLIMTIDNQMVGIKATTAAIGTAIPQIGMGTNEEALKLTWCAPNQCYYSTVFDNGVLTNKIARLSLNGGFTILGSVTIPGETVYQLESVSFDVLSGKLYCSASLDGSMTSNQDYEAEKLIQVDTMTLVGSVVGQFMHSSPYTPEADDIAIDATGTLYYEDSRQGSAAFRRFYSQNLDMSGSSTLIYEDNVNAGILGFEVLEGYLYFTSNRVLHRINLTTLQESTVGVLFTAQEYNGNPVRGLARMGRKTASISDLEYRFNVSPNPTENLLSIESDIQINSIEIIDFQGRIVKTMDNNVEVIDISNLSAGTYLLNLHLVDGTAHSTKIVRK